jgi:hypothetical protein
MQQIIPPSMLFDFTLKLHRVDQMPTGRDRKLKLPSHTRLPIPATLNRQSGQLEVSVAWNPEGLGVSVAVHGRKSPPGGSSSNLRNCDHLLLFFDTRHTASVHRAGSYCSSLLAVPSDEEQDGKPSLAVRPIAQQKDVRQLLDVTRCGIHARVSKTGYRTDVWIPASQLFGFQEVPDIGYLGFYCLVQDTEHGEMPLSVADDFPVTFDPSTWLRLELEQ